MQALPGRPMLVRDWNASVVRASDARAAGGGPEDRISDVPTL